MPTRVQWHDEQQKILVFQGEQFTWRDFYDTLHEADGLLEPIKHPIAVIFAFDDLPTGVISQHVKFIMVKTPDIIKCSVVFISRQNVKNTFIQTVIETTNRVFGSRFNIFFATSFEDAIQTAQTQLARSNQEV